MSNNLVSIIIPVYNVATYLDECLNSVIKQTYKNLEIILVDDGSTDDSLEICNLFAKKDKRITVLHQDNAGVSSARNRGLNIITGEYVLFIDSDDKIELNMVEILERVIDRNDKVDAVFCGYKEFDDISGKIIKVVSPDKPKKVNRDNGVLEIFGEYSTMLWNKMFRSSIIGNTDLFDETLKIGEDELWMIDVLKKADSIVLIGIPLYYYRNRITGVTKEKKYSDTKMTDFESQKKVLNSIKEYKSEKLVLYAQERLYYIGQDIMKLAYYDGYFDIYQKIDNEIEEARKIWYENHVNKLGVLRRKLVEKMMRMKFPKIVIKMFDK